MKLNLIVLNPDQTGIMRKCKTKGNTVFVDKHWKPEFTEGRSIFVLKKKFLYFFSRTFRYGFWYYGSKTLLEPEPGTNRIYGTAWTWKEAEDHLEKMAQLNLAKDKPFSNLQIYLIMALLGIVIVLQLIGMRL